MLRALIASAVLIASGVSGSVATPSRAATAKAESVAGTWRGPFTGTVFTFEFTRNGESWTGRYQSEKYKKWHDLQNVTVADGSVRFSFESQPPSNFVLKLAPSGNALTGTATFGPHDPLPLTLQRV